MGKKVAHELPVQTTDNTKEVLLEAGTLLFAEEGYEKATVKQISDRAGVNVSLVSYHFGGKEGLYRSCLQQFGENRLNSAERILSAPKDTAEYKVRLEMFITEMLQNFAEEPTLCRLIQREIENPSSVVEDIFEKTFLKVFLTLVDFNKSAIKNNILKKEVDPLLSASFLMSALTKQFSSHSFAHRHLKHSIFTEEGRAKIKEQFLNIFLNGALRPDS